MESESKFRDTLLVEVWNIKSLKQHWRSDVNIEENQTNLFIGGVNRTWVLKVV